MKQWCSEFEHEVKVQNPRNASIKILTDYLAVLDLKKWYDHQKLYHLPVNPFYNSNEYMNNIMEVRIGEKPAYLFTYDNNNQEKAFEK